MLIRRESIFKLPTFCGILVTLAVHTPVLKLALPFADVVRVLLAL